MITGQQIGVSPKKPTPGNNSKERSMTPGKTMGRGFNRNSKSLMKREEIKAQKPLTLMHPIEQGKEGGKLFYIGKGNNYEGIRMVLLQRKGLMETNNPENLLLLKWTQNSFSFKWHRLGKDCLCFNHFQFHREISNKQRLVWNMLNFCESNKLNAFSYLPTTFIIDLTSGEEDMALHSFLKFYNRNIPEGAKGLKVQSILLPKVKNIPYMSAQQLKKKSMGNFYCKPICPKTFFGSSNSYLWILKPTFMNRGRGVSLFSNLKQFEQLIWQYYQGEGLEDYHDKQGIGDMFPEKTQLEVEIKTVKIDSIIQNSPQKQKNISPSKKQEQKTSSKHQIKIQSKGQNYSQDKIDQTKTQIKTDKTEIKLEKNQKNQTKSEIKPQMQRSQIKIDEKSSNLRVLSFIVQKYIQCPMLIKQKKFDIRVWVLLTQNYEVYFFKEGYLRFSSHKYSADNHKNPFIHLTNNSVQKYCNQYDQGSGNQLTLSDLKEYLPNEETYSKIYNKIKQIIWLSMCSARRKININSRKQCFEVFGYDFMIDQAYKTWFIEVNTNPAIDPCSSILKMLVPRMLDDTFKLTIDKLFNLKQKEGRDVYHVKGFSDQENMWELLGDFKEGVNQKTMGKKLTLVRR